MQPFSNPPATIVVLDEKEPLLPLNSQPVLVTDRKLRTKAWLTEHLYRALVYGLFFYIIFIVMNTPLMQFKGKEDDNVSVNNAFQLESLQDIKNYNENELNSPFASGIVVTCNGDNKPTIPYEGLSEFEFDQKTFPRLSIEQKTRTHKGDGSLQVTSGKTVVIEDKTLSKVSVKFDLKFDYEELQDIFWIEQTEDEEQGVYSLVIRADGSYNHNGCVTIDINVRVPDASALNTLAISLSNAGINLKEGLTFENLAISVSNGHVEFEEGISSGITAFTVANGYVSGVINTLSNDLSSSIANGHVKISIKQIEQFNSENISIKSVVANGQNILELPSTFNSQFQLKSFVGRRTVESSNPQKIHRDSGGWGITSGYYGDDKDTNNSVLLKTSSGSVKLAYI